MSPERGCFEIPVQGVLEVDISFYVQSKLTSQFWKLVVFVQSSALGSLADAETRVLKGIWRPASGPSFIIIRSTFS